MKEQNEALDIVRTAIQAGKYRIKDQRCHDAVNRLISHPDAVIAWGQMYKKQPKTNHVDDGFYFSVTMIVHDAIAAWHPKSIKKTAKEIRAAAKKATELARDLAELIKDNYSLQTITLTDCLHSEVQASLDRILAGVLCGSEKGKGLVFPPEVEAQLPDDSRLTTKDASLVSG